MGANTLCVQGLDEVQCFLLLRRVQKEDQTELPATVGPAMLLRLSQYYFTERASLLKIVQVRGAREREGGGAFKTHCSVPPMERSRPGACGFCSSFLTRPHLHLSKP
jgi:hypothetical protein